MIWDVFFEAGGWGMYPTLMTGFLALTSGGLYALRPEPRRVWLVVSLAAATLGSGLLSTTTGLVNTAYHAGSSRVEAGARLAVLIQGTAESLHNLVLTWMVLVVTALLMSIGALRASRRAPAVG